MIGETDWFSEIFGSVPEGDISWNVRVAKSAIKAGLGVVLTYPNDKKAACVLTSAQAQKADIAAQNAAKEAGNLGWEKVRHACGVKHVITDEKDLNKVGAKKLLADGANPAIAPGTGEKRVLVADLDTRAQMDAFAELWEEYESESIDLTVSSPGVFNDGSWKHKDGGHVWFDVPDDVELPTTKGKFAWCECHAYRPSYPNPDKPGERITCPRSFAIYWASGYVLVPPSVRPEGAYRVVGSAVTAPEWLTDMCRESTTGSAVPGSEGVLGSFNDDPIDAWSREVSWSDILTAEGFTPAGHDTCGCPTFTRPGDATHSKSVTGHEPGCSFSWSEDSTGHLPIHIWSDALGGDRTMSKLSWIAESRYGGSVAEAMRQLGLKRLTTPSNLGLEIVDGEIVDIENDPKESSAEIDGGNSEESGSSALLDWFHNDPNALQMLRNEVERIYIRDKAKAYVEEQTVKASWKAPTEDDDLSLLFDNPPPTVTYAIDDVLPINGNAILFAQYKTGKSTFVLECVRALADREPFLGRFGVNTSGRVALWNYELAGDMMTSWFRDTQMNHPENVRLLNLRGKRIPLHTEYGQQWTINWLREREIRTWIIDPAVRAMIGWGDESDNNAVTLFTDMLDEIKEKAGVSELIVAHHTGRALQEAGEERARGATRWDDWPDSRWILTKIVGGETRFIRMTGRGNDLPERALSYDPQRRRVALVGNGDPLASSDRRTYGDEALRVKILDFITANPGLTKNKVMEGVGLTSHSKAGPIVSALVPSNLVYTIPGPNRSQLHYPGEQPKEAIDLPSARKEIES